MFGLQGLFVQIWFAHISHLGEVKANINSQHDSNQTNYDRRHQKKVNDKDGRIKKVSAKETNLAKLATSEASCFFSIKTHK